MMLVDRISKEKLLENLEATFGYDFHRSIYEIRPDYTYDVSCMGSVSEAIIAYLDSYDFESAIRNAVPIGGDSDIIDAMTGAIAQAAYEMSKALADYCYASRSPYFHKNVLLSLATRTATFVSHCFPDLDFWPISAFLDTERYLVILRKEVKLA